MFKLIEIATSLDELGMTGRSSQWQIIAVLLAMTVEMGTRDAINPLSLNGRGLG